MVTVDARNFGFDYDVTDRPSDRTQHHDCKQITHEQITHHKHIGREIQRGRGRVELRIITSIR